MKKFLLMSIASLAVTLSAGAATINGTCSVNGQTIANGIGSATPLTCVSFNSLATGGVLTSAQLTFTADYVLNTQLQTPLANTVTITFTPDVITGFAAGTVTMSNLEGQFVKSNNSPQFSTSATVNPASSFSISVVSTANNLGAGVDNSNGSAFLTYTYTADGEVPEPATFVLLGAGLVGLGIYRRRMA